MFKRLLLFLAIFMACPAFATLGRNAAGDGTLTNTDYQSNCAANPLVYHNNEATSGTYTFVAKWEKKKYNVEYRPGTCSGRGTTLSNALEYDTDYTVLAPGANSATNVTVPSGYQFDGWTESLTGGVVNAGYKYEPWQTDGGLVLTANCFKTACEPGEYLNGNECTPCPSAYPESVAGATSITQCYVQRDPRCNESDGTVPDHCVGVTQGACLPTCPTTKYKVYSNATGDADGEIEGETEYSCIKEYTEIVGESGYHYDSSLKKCVPDNYVVTYNCKEGRLKSSVASSGSVHSDNVQFGDDENLYAFRKTTETCEYEGHVVKPDWKCYKTGDSGTGVVPWTDEQVWNLEYSVTCDAEWDADEYDVKYYCDSTDMADVTTDKSVYENQAVFGQLYQVANKSVLDNKCSGKEGYTFQRWACETKRSGGAVVTPTYNSGANISSWAYVDDMKCAAEWGTTDFNITYEVRSNGTNVSSRFDLASLGNPSTYNVNTDVVLKKPTKAGYHFDGDWYECNNPTSIVTRVAGGHTGNLQLCIDVDLYECSVVYVGCVNGDCNNTVDLNQYIDSQYQTYTVDSSVNLSRLQNLTIPDYDYDGKWYSDAGLRRATSTAGGACDGKNIITVYTNLKPYYRVTYNCNGGTGNPVDNTAYQGGVDVSVLGDSVCSMDGYTYTRWLCNNSPVNAGGTIYRINENKNCVPDWNKKDYTVTYDCKVPYGTNKQFMDEDLYEGDSITVANTDSCGNIVGYDFDGWKCNDSATNSVLRQAGDVFTMPGFDVTCEANWSGIDYHVTYVCDSEDASSVAPVDNNAYHYSDSVSVVNGAANTCKNEGRDFEYWTCDSNVGQVQSGGSFRMPANDVECRASWKPYRVTYTVTIDGHTMTAADGVTMPNNITTFTRNTPNTTLLKPTKTGYTFDGWYECNDSSKTPVDVIPGGRWRNLDLCGVMGQQSCPVIYVGCINGNCNNSVSLNQYVDSAYQTYTTGHSVNLSRLQSLVIPDYDYDGKWYSDATLRRATSTAGGTCNGNSSITVYTNLKPYYHVTYDCNGGVGNPTDNTLYLSGKKVETLDGGQCNKPGSTFQKWICGINQVQAGGTFVILADTTCYADWSTNSYVVNYDCNGGKTISSRMTDSVTYGASYVFAEYDNKCSNDGYSFVEWLCSEATNPSAQYHYNTNDEQSTILSWSLLDNLNCAAIWDADEYPITYYQNTNSTDMITLNLSPASYKVTDVVALPSSVPADVNVGHTFLGWSLVRSGGSTIVGWGAGTRTGAVEVYAQWEKNDYVIEYDGGMAGSRHVTDVHMNDKAVKYGDRVVLDRNTYAMTGYKFTGWLCETKESHAAVSVVNETPAKEPSTSTYVISSYDYLEDTVCTAQWEELTYNITYKPGNCGIREYTVNGALVYDDMYEFETPTGVRTGYAFLGWRSSEDLTAPDYFDNTQYGPWNTEDTLWNGGAGITVYAICEQVPYVVEYYCDNTDASKIDEYTTTKYYDNSVTVQPKACEGYGFTFESWTCDNGIGEKVPGTKFNMPAANVRCEANLIEDEYTITYDCNGGTGAPEDDDTYKYGVSATTMNNTCEKPGYDFTMWQCSTGEDLLDINENADFTVYGDTACSAQWNPKRYDIVYNAGSCDGGSYTDTGVLRYGAEFGVKGLSTELGIEAPKGYKFMGWALDDESGDVDYVHMDEEGNSQTYGPWNMNYKDYDNDGLTLYAVCQLEEYHIYYDLQGGSGFVSNLQPLGTYTINTPVDIETLPDALHNGWYVFRNWTDDAAGEGFVYTKVPTAEMIANPRDITLYAQWDAAGEIFYDCHMDVDETYRDKRKIGTVAKTPVMEDMCQLEECRIYEWDCEGVSYGSYEDIVIPAPADPQNPVPLLCLAKKTCADEEYHITYKVFAVDETTGEVITELSQVYNNEELVKVSDLQPDTYTTATAVYYPFQADITLPGYIFDGWYDSAEFENRTYHTPVKPEEEPGEDIVVYGRMFVESVYTISYYDENGVEYSAEQVANMNNPTTYTIASSFGLNAALIKPYHRFLGWHLGSVDGELVEHIQPLDGTTVYRGHLDLYAASEFECNEPGHEHWLRLGTDEKDRVCLYETRQTNATPAIRMKRNNGDGYYYLMLSLNPETLMHEGSTRKMRIQHGDTVYNVCDKSTCPELGNTQP